MFTACNPRPGLIYYTMKSEISGTARAGKYCPRCHAMTQREQVVCGQCGHQFRTGTSDAPAASGPEPDLLHRTMQFVLPPLARRTAAPDTAAIPDASEVYSKDVFSQAVRRSRRTVFAVLAALALCLGAALFWHTPRRPVPQAATPAGIWQTTLHGKASANAHLEFALQTGGTGRFSWQEAGPDAFSGQTPLRWHQNADGTLALILAKPAAGDPVSQTLIRIFNRNPWPWHVDPARRQLVLGTLVFTEKP